jgi:hypothetical protein
LWLDLRRRLGLGLSDRRFLGRRGGGHDEEPGEGDR